MTEMQKQHPQVFISYSHSPGKEHKKQVLRLADWLRSYGIVSEIDQYEMFPPQGWPDWCLEQLEAADYVLAVCEEAYRQSFERKQPLDIGLGVTWEARAIIDWLYKHIVSGQSKIIPIILRAEDITHVPDLLRRYTTFDVGSPEGLDKLYRFLTGQPEIVPQKLGAIVLAREVTKDINSKPKAEATTSDVPKEWPIRFDKDLQPNLFDAVDGVNIEALRLRFPCQRLRVTRQMELFAAGTRSIVIEEGCTGTLLIYTNGHEDYRFEVTWDPHNWLMSDRGRTYRVASREIRTPLSCSTLMESVEPIDN